WGRRKDLRARCAPPSKKSKRNTHSSADEFNEDEFNLENSSSLGKEPRAEDTVRAFVAVFNLPSNCRRPNLGYSCVGYSRTMRQERAAKLSFVPMLYLMVVMVSAPC